MPQIIVTLGESLVNKFVFDKDIISVGRSRDNDIVIENRAVSRNHARIRRENGDFVISDLNSANGIYVNGSRVTKQRLANDDVITIGKHTLLFKHELLSEEALISDAFGAERTIIVDRAPVAFLVVSRGKQKDTRYQIEKAEMAIGSARESDICLNEWFVSKQHAVIHRQGGTFLIRDAGSWRGTKVNDIAVTQAALNDGDEIQIGGTRLVFHVTAPQAPPAAGRNRTPPERIRTPFNPIAPPRSRFAEKPLEPVPAGEEEPVRAGGSEDFIRPSSITPLEVVPGDKSPEMKPFYGGAERFLREEARVVDAEAAKPAAIVEVLPEPAVLSTAPPRGTAPPPRDAQAAAPSPDLLDEARMWEDALKNKSPVIRKQAAKMLKKITGRDYDY